MKMKKVVIERKSEVLMRLLLIVTSFLTMSLLTACSPEEPDVHPHGETEYGNESAQITP